MIKLVRRIVDCSLLLCIVFMLFSCSSGESPQERLEISLHEVRDAAVAGNIGDFMERVADDFSGQKGGFDRASLRSMLRVQLLKHSRVTATIVNDEYEMYPGRAVVKLSVLMTGGPANWLPDTGRVYQITTAWREDDEQWVLISAVWE